MKFRTRLQISLTTIFVSISVVAVLAGILANARHRAQESARRIHDLGGRAFFSQDCDTDGRRLVAFPEMDRDSIAKGWSLRALYNTLFLEISNVDLRGTSIRDSDLRCLQDLRQLMRIHLDNTAITDAGLANLYELKQLQFVGLENTSVTELGFECLRRKVPRLETNRSFRHERVLKLLEEVVNTRDDGQSQPDGQIGQ